MQHEDGGSAGMRHEEDRVGAVVGEVTAGARGLPAQDRDAGHGLIRGVRIEGRSSEELGGGKTLALVEVGLEGRAAAAVETVAALDAVHKNAHGEIERASDLASNGLHMTARLSSRRRMGD